MAREGREGREGIAHKIISFILRLAEFCFAVIVLGILCNFAYHLTIAQTYADGRIIYTLVVSGIALVYSFFVCIPFDSLFLGFPVDFILWVMWLVAFCLLETLTASSTCSAAWFNNYWGYYWGDWWRVGPVGTVSINRTGCAQWRTVLSFSFIASFTHLLSGILGVYVWRRYVRVADTVQHMKHHKDRLSKSNEKGTRLSHNGDVEHSAAANGN